MIHMYIEILKSTVLKPQLKSTHTHTHTHTHTELKEYNLIKFKMPCGDYLFIISK